MSRVLIELPDNFAFSTELDVLIQHINAAQHLANEQLIALLNEARMRYMATINLASLHLPARSFINADLAVIYKSEAHHGDRLRIEITAADFNQYGCDFFYRVSRIADNRLIAVAKTAMLLFDYEKNSLKLAPEHFESLFKH